MKRLLTIIALQLVSIVGIMAQTDSKSESAGIEFESLSHNFGVMSQGGEKVVYEFAFTNQSDGPLIITRTTNSCRCISVVAPKRPIKPGQKGVIRVTFDPKDRGVFNKAIDIYANIPGERVTLLVTGEVK